MKQPPDGQDDAMNDDIDVDGVAKYDWPEIDRRRDGRP